MQAQDELHPCQMEEMLISRLITRCFTTLRLSKELKPAQEELQGPEEIEVEGVQSLNDALEGSGDDADEPDEIHAN